MVTRYPDSPKDFTLAELQRKWSELIRVLDSRDREPVPPAVIYGRNIAVGGLNSDNVTYVTAGTSLSTAPTSDYWHIYEYQIPLDVGMVYVQPVSVSSGARVQIQTFLPLAQASEGRTITIAAGNPDSIGFNSFNLGVFATSGSGNQISTLFGGGVTIQNQVSGALNVSVSVSTRIAQYQSAVSILPLPADVQLRTFLSAAGSIGYVGTLSGASFSPATNNFVNDTSVSGSLNISVSSTATYSGPLNFTFRAFGERWIQIS